MFIVSDADAAMIRAAYDQGGEFSASVELRRLFPGIQDNEEARDCARTIAGWKPLAQPPQETPDMPDQDQIIDAAMASALQADAIRTQPLVAWVVTRDEVTYPGEFVARLVTDTPTSYVMLADTLAGLQAQLPIDLVRTDRQPADPPGVVEVWFPAAAVDPGNSQARD